MKILYVSCHAVLERDETLLLRELGHDVTLVGFSEQFDPEPFDTIIFMHMPETLSESWESIKHKRVIFRSIGQMVPWQEKLLKPLVAEGLEIIRYSPKEATIKDFAGEKAMIRFYKDPDEYTGWHGMKRDVINFTQSLKQRASFCGYDTIMAATEGFPRGFYGNDSEQLPDGHGYVSHEDQIKILRRHGVYIFTGTYPASYTLSFIEAAMTGIPVVAVGPKLGNGSMFQDQNTYEAHELLGHHWWSDDIETLRNYIQELLKSKELSRQISEVQRAKAIELFGKEKIKQQWEEFLR